MLNVATYVLDKIAHRTFTCAQNARAILPGTSNVPFDLSCVTIARRDFMIGLSSFYSFNNSHFGCFEIKKFIQQFLYFINIKGAHSKAGFTLRTPYVHNRNAQTNLRISRA